MTVVALCASTLLMAGGTVLAGFLEQPWLRTVTKPLASGGFLALALYSGALQGAGAYGPLILLGLGLSWWGDVFLMAEDKPPLFLAGLGFFLLGHVAYAAAFVTRGIDPTAAAACGVALSGLGWVVWRWLGPHLPSDMAIPVRAYIVVIASMETLALAASVHTGQWMMFCGATLFFVSDLAVARQQFVHGTPWNAAWGLPLYYTAQLVLALTV